MMVRKRRIERDELEEKKKGVIKQDGREVSGKKEEGRGEKTGIREKKEEKKLREKESRRYEEDEECTGKRGEKGKDVLKGISAERAEGSKERGYRSYREEGKGVMEDTRMERAEMDDGKKERGERKKCEKEER